MRYENTAVIWKEYLGSGRIYQVTLVETDDLLKLVPRFTSLDTDSIPPNSWLEKAEMLGYKILWLDEADEAFQEFGWNGFLDYCKAKNIPVEKISLLENAK